MAVRQAWPRPVALSCCGSRLCPKLWMKQELKWMSQPG